MRIFNLTERKKSLAQLWIFFKHNQFGPVQVMLDEIFLLIEIRQINMTF